MTQLLPQSPCIGVCTVADNDLCMGCFRSMHEITHWLSFSEKQREEITQQLDARRDELFA